MLWIKVFTLTLSIFFLGVSPKGLVAKENSSVENIIVSGNQRIATGTIRSYLLIQEGDPFNARRVDQSLKSLFSTGYFADVSIKRQENSLIVKVVENPVINQIAFEGNLRIKDELLKSEVKLKPRVVFTRTNVQKDVKRILDIYRANGRFGATVDPKIIQLPQNRADLVFEIDEGPQTKILSIRFIGNKIFDDDDLKSVVSSKEAKWYRFLTSADTYDPDRLQVDRELLRQHYLAEGYADFRIDSAIAELVPDRTAFFITITVNEGDRYKFGTIEASSAVRNIEVAELKPLIGIKKGDWYDNTLIEDAVKQISDKVGNLGYAFVQVHPKVEKNSDQKEVNLNINVLEGSRAFIERIDIRGNVRTADSVIRREFRVVEGDAFNASKLRRSRQRIQDLNYFKKVVLEKKAGSTSDKTVITLDVEEKSTGSLNLGVGYGTDAGPLVDVTLRERNLLGLGQHLSLATTLAAEKSSANLSFTEPYFLGRDIAAGFDLFHIRRDLQSTRSHDSLNTGLGLRASYPLSETLRQAWQYGLSVEEVENLSSSASSLIKAQEGTRYASTIKHSLLYDTRDSKIVPSEGMSSRFSNEVAGLGGNVFYFRNIISGAKYYAPAEEWVLSTSGKIGHILGLGQDIQVADRFFLGGDTLRGFATAGVGPRDRNTKDSLGGEWIYNGTIQLRMPLGLPSELAITGRLFSDIGSVGGVSPSSSAVFDSASIRASLGAGLGWRSPFGPINIDIGFPILKEDLDETETVRLNFGTRF